MEIMGMEISPAAPYYETKKPMSNTKAAVIGAAAGMGLELARDSFGITSIAVKNPHNYTSFKDALKQSWNFFKKTGDFGTAKEGSIYLKGILTKDRIQQVSTAIKGTKSIGLKYAAAGIAIAGVIGAAAGVIIKKIANSGNKE